MSDEAPARPLSLRAFALLVLAQLVLAVALTAPVAWRLARGELWGGGPDTYQSLWNFWWLKSALASADERVFFSDWIFHPAGMPLALHTFCPLKSLLAIPLGLVLDPAGCHDLLMLATFWAAGVSAFLLVYDWCGRAGAALLGALVFAYSPYHGVHALGHLNLASIEFFPLYFLCLARVAGAGPAWLGARGRAALRWWAVGLGVAWGLTVWVDFQYALFLLLFTPVFWLGVGRAHAAPSTREPGALSRALGWAALPAGLLVAPLALAIGRELLRFGLPGKPGGIDVYSLDLLAPLVPSPLNHVSGGLLGPFLARFPDWYESIERVGYVGLVPLVLGLCALRGPSAWRPWRWMLVAAWILALGPGLRVLGHDTGVPLPGAFFEHVPGLDQFRAPARFQVLVFLALALLVPPVAARWIERLRSAWRAPVQVLVLALVAADLTAFPSVLAPVEVPGVVRALAARPDHDAVHLLALEEAEYVWMYWQSLCGKKLLIGHAARVYPEFERRAAETRERLWAVLQPDADGRYQEPDEMRRVYREVGVRYLVAPLRSIATSKGLRTRYERLVAHFFPEGPVYADERHELFVVDAPRR